MSQPDANDGPSASGRPDPQRSDKGSLASTLRRLLTAVVLMGGLALAAGVGLRLYLMTDAGRGAVVAMLDGADLGAAGRLRLQGLKGDLLGHFQVARLSLSDAHGPWLSLTDGDVDWRPSGLLFKTVRVHRLAASRLRIDRAPAATSPRSNGEARLPVSLIIDGAQLRVETGAALSGREGAWRVTGVFNLRRNGRLRVHADALSALRAGDGLHVDVRLGERRGFNVDVSGVEANGGALSGLLGLNPAAPLNLTLTATGAPSGGRGAAALRSGVKDVLAASAKWDQRGGRGEGWIDLSASRLTHYFSERLGGMASGSFSARPAEGRRFSIDAALRAPQGTMALSGLVDPDRRQARGLKVDASIPSLAAWLPFPKIGAARYVGRVDGGWGDLHLTGVADGRQTTLWGYELAHGRGPLTIDFRRGQWRLVGDIAGDGGGGQAVQAQLVGASPRLRFDVGVAPNGRFLFRSLDVEGRALVIHAAGGQSLFGGMEFNGSALAADLSHARPGTRGRLTAGFRAREPAGADGWTFDFDAAASGLQTGWSDADHFLGAAPHATGTGVLDGPHGLRLGRVSVKGAALEADGSGDVGWDSRLTGDFTWRLNGPFTVGPAEVAGAAKGRGRLSGALSAPRADIEAELASLDLGRLQITPAKATIAVEPTAAGVAGAFQVSGRAGGAPATLKAAFQSAEGLLALSDIAADAGGVKAGGSVNFRPGGLTTGDLDVTIGPGAFLTSGRLEGRIQLSNGDGERRARVTLDGQGLVLPETPLVFRRVRLRGDGPLAALPLRLTLDAASPQPIQFDGQGVLQDDKNSLTLTLQGAGRLRQSDFKSLEPFQIRLDASGSQGSGAAAIAGGQVNFHFRTNKEGAQALFDLKRLSIDPFTQDYTGLVSGRLELTGSGSRLAGSLNAGLEGLRSRDEPASQGLTGALQARLEGGVIHVKATATSPQGLRAEGAADLPAVAAASPFALALDPKGQLQGRFNVDGEIKPLWNLIGGGQLTMSGRVVSSGSLAGTLEAPILIGAASLTSGALHDIVSGLTLSGLEIESAFGANDLTIRRLAGSDGKGGSVAGEGRINLSNEASSTFNIRLNRFQLLDNEYGRASASGTLLVTHPAKGAGKLSGALVIDRADFAPTTPTSSGVVPLDVVEINRPDRAGEAKGVQPETGPPVALDVTVKATRGVYVRGRGLNVELSLDGRIGGDIERPQLSGSARVVAGSYDFAGKRFDVDNSGAINLASDPADIRLDLSAVWQDPTINAVVRVQGTAARPEIKLTSIPVLPQDEVLARVLFGVSASQLSAAQGAEMASALASLAGGGGFDVIGNLRQFAGLDRLAIGSTLSATTTISGGKYLTKDVYLELTGGARNGAGAQLEWRIRKNLSVISRYGAALDPRYPNDSDARMSIRYRTDF